MYFTPEGRKAAHEVSAVKGMLKPYRELYPGLATVAIFAVMGPTFIDAYALAQDANAQYWVGHFAWYILFVIPAIIVLAHLVQSWARRPLFLALVASVAVPPLLSSIVGYLYMLPVSHVVVRLRSSDCTTFESKFHIESAYREAASFYHDCVAAAAKNASKPVETVEKEMVISQCPKYDPDASGYQREWMYLEALEKKDYCAGWCESGKSLWTTQRGVLGDSCALAAASQMDALVQTNASRMMLTGLIGFLLAFFAILLVNEWISRSEDTSLHW